MTSFEPFGMNWTVKNREEYKASVRVNLYALKRQTLNHGSWINLFEDDFHMLINKTISQLDKIFGLGYLQAYGTDYAEVPTISDKKIAKANRLLKRLENEYLIKKLSE